jgi:indoleamine 2,3-dioxygenase
MSLTNEGEGSLDELSKKLNEVTAIVRATTKVGSRMFEKLDPKVFYNDRTSISAMFIVKQRFTQLFFRNAAVRPYLSGWKDNKNLPSLVYEGAFDNKPLSWAGGSAAQSSLIQVSFLVFFGWFFFVTSSNSCHLQSWDAALGVQHTSDKTQFILEMRKYMLPKHRQFVEYLAAKSPSIRDVVASARSTHPHLEQAFDLCVKTVVEFRTMHIQLVARYVVSQSTKSDEQVRRHSSRFARAERESLLKTTPYVT